MAIPDAAQGHPIVTPNPGLPLVDERGNLTNRGAIALQQMHNYIVNMNRTMPCNAATVSNVITLTLLDIQPTVNQYTDYEVFSFVADANSTGALTAKVVTATGTLGTLKVYKNNGAAQSGLGDITAGYQYTFTYVDSLDSGNGGFVQR